MKIEEAVDKCKESALDGWNLVAFAQKLVFNNMEYSYTNSFDKPEKAFEKGMGYCWQQASSLNLILNKLGIESHLVHAVKNHFPDKIYKGVLVKSHYSGHVWCRVKIDKVEKDVCPGNANNTPGLNHFIPISKVMEWNSWISFWSYFGSALVNWIRIRRIKKEMDKNNY